jgi:hypothetical protein
MIPDLWQDLRYGARTFMLNGFSKGEFDFYRNSRRIFQNPQLRGQL